MALNGRRALFEQKWGEVTRGLGAPLTLLQTQVCLSNCKQVYVRMSIW